MNVALPPLQGLELFSGVGMLGEGLRAGLDHLGIPYRTICHVEREAYAASVLVSRMEEGSLDAAPVWSDVTTFDASAWRGKVDCIAAGFPCQDLSVAGKRAGLDGKRSGLFFEVTRIADDSGAWLIVLENVAGISSATATVMDEAEELEERAAARVLGELADLGWDAEWLTLSASDVGASHGRARWFCIAWRMADACNIGHERNEGAGWEAFGRTEFAKRIMGNPSSERLQECGFSGERELSAEVGAGLHDRFELAGVQLAHPERICCKRRGNAGDMACACRAVEIEAWEWEWCGNSADGCGCAVADTSEPGLQGQHIGNRTNEKGRQEQDGSTGKCCGLFAPGPSDPRWADIIRERPELAPALAGKLNPNFVEFLMGWPIGWSNANVNERGNSEKSAAGNTAEWRKLLQMWMRHFFESSPSRLQQTSGGGNSMPQLSSEIRTFGEQSERKTCSCSVQNLRDDVSTEKRQKGEIMRESRMPEEVRTRSGEETMECRAQRLKCCGNGVVPLQAAAAVVVLMRRGGIA